MDVSCDRLGVLCCFFAVIEKKLIMTASFQVTFEGIKGLSFQSDIAIDDVSIADGSCPGENTVRSKFHLPRKFKFFFLVL